MAAPAKLKNSGLAPRFVLVIFLLHCLPFATRPALIGSDEPHYALMAHSIAVDGNFQITDDYEEVAAGSAAAGRKRAGRQLDQHQLRVNDREVFSHPLGLPLLAAPLLRVQQLLAPGAPPDLLLGLFGLMLTFWALLASWRLLWRWTDDARVAALTAFGAYFSSPLWFYSRTFFTEPYTWSFAVLGLAALAGGRVLLAAGLLALTLAMKETALLLVAPILVGVALRDGLAVAGRLALGPLAFGVLFMVKNSLLIGHPFATFQPYRYGSLAEGVPGLLLDPARGILWFAPLLSIGALIAWLFVPRARSVPSWLAGVTFSAYFLASACWVDWRGGSGYGPRLILPGLAALALPLAGLFASVTARRSALRSVVIGLFVAGFTVQWCAALDPVAAFWSIEMDQLLGAKTWRTGTGILVGIGLMTMLWYRIPPRPF